MTCGDHPFKDKIKAKFCLELRDNWKVLQRSTGGIMHGRKGDCMAPVCMELLLMGVVVRVCLGS